MSCNALLAASGLGKAYQIYDRPSDRLKQYLKAPFARAARLQPKTYGRSFWALRDVSFEIGKGESVAIIGQNGAGKSTLLQLLCGTLQPTAGSIEAQGRIAALLELGAGFDPEFTGRENARLNGAILGLSTAMIDERMGSIEAFADIGGFFDQAVKTYSSGMYMRLAFAAAIHMDASILVIDEALAVGDARFQAKCITRLEELKARGVTLLFVSHSVPTVRAICDRAIWLDGGRLVADGPSADVTAKYLEWVYDSDRPANQDQRAPGKAASSPKPPEADPPILPPIRKSHVGLINRWGTHVGAILDAYAVDSNGRPTNLISDDEPVTIQVVIRPPQSSARSQFSVAFSIKNTQGTDLIAGTTWDGDRLALDRESAMTVVRFAFENCLNNGEYILTVALEDRSNGAIEYLDYVDGIDVLHSTQSKTQYGIFVPQLTKSARILRGMDERAIKAKAA